MPEVIDHYYSLVSPWTYLGGPRLDAIACRAGAAVDHKPADFGGIFAASGGLALARRAPQRQAYRLLELARWRDFLGVELNLRPKHFPAPDDLAARVVVAAKRAGADAGRLSHALPRPVWAEERRVADPGTLRASPRRTAWTGPPCSRRRRRARSGRSTRRTPPRRS